MVITYEIIEFVLLSGPRREGLTENLSLSLARSLSLSCSLSLLLQWNPVLLKRKGNKIKKSLTSLKYTALEEFKSRAVP